MEAKKTISACKAFCSLQSSSTPFLTQILNITLWNTKPLLLNSFHGWGGGGVGWGKQNRTGIQSG